MTAASIGCALAGAALRAAQEYAPLPADPPIGGPVWTVVVPAALLVCATGATWLLYRRFSGGD